MLDRKFTVGVIIESRFQHGSERVTARAMVRREIWNKPGEYESFPTNPDGGGLFERPMPLLDGLSLDGYVSDTSGQFALFEPAYLNWHRVTQSQAKGMRDTLDRVNKAIRKAEAREPGDILVAFCKAIGAEWFGEPRAPLDGYRMYSDSEWYWRSIGAARDKFREEIKAAEERFAPRKRPLLAVSS